MTTTEEQATTASGAAQEPQADTKPNAAPRKPRVAPSKRKSRKETTPAKKAATAKKRAKARQKPVVARQGTKTAKVVDLLKRSGGATLKEIMRASGWQAHSVRGFISGHLGKKMGLSVRSFKRDGERVYSLKG